jgi:hypothetical protein
MRASSVPQPAARLRCARHHKGTVSKHLACVNAAKRRALREWITVPTFGGDKINKVAVLNEMVAG